MSPVPNVPLSYPSASSRDHAGTRNALPDISPMHPPAHSASPSPDRSSPVIPSFHSGQALSAAKDLVAPLVGRGGRTLCGFVILSVPKDLAADRDRPFAAIRVTGILSTCLR